MAKKVTELKYKPLVCCLYYPILINRNSPSAAYEEPLQRKNVNYRRHANGPRCDHLAIRTLKTVQKVKEVLESPERRKKMVNTNYEVATRYYSYTVLRRKLNYPLNIFLEWICNKEINAHAETD